MGGGGRLEEVPVVILVEGHRVGFRRGKGRVGAGDQGSANSHLRGESDDTAGDV